MGTEADAAPREPGLQGSEGRGARSAYDGGARAGERTLMASASARRFWRTRFTHSAGPSHKYPQVSIAGVTSPPA